MATVPVLVFVPAVLPTENQSALRIAQLLAQSASKSRPGTYTVGSSPTSTHAIVRGPAGDDRLEVVQVDYQTALLGPENGSDKTGKATTQAKPLDAVRALWFACFATWRLVVLLFTRKRPKSRNAKIQIAVACGLVALLWASFLILLAAALSALAAQSDTVTWLGWLPSWLSDSSVVLPGSLGLLVVLYWRVHDPVLLLGSRLRAMMGYAEQQDDLLRLTAVVDQAIDDVLEDRPDARLYLFGYSFGSIVLIDALFPSRDREVERRGLGNVVGLTTMGCPADFLRLLYPDHFAGRVSRLPPDTDWTNIYIPADVLGSNFREDGDDVSEQVDPSGADEPRPTRNVAVGRRATKVRAMVTMDGFQVHGRYWARLEPRHLEVLVPKWLPATDDPVPGDPDVPVLSGATLSGATQAARQADKRAGDGAHGVSGAGGSGTSPGRWRRTDRELRRRSHGDSA